MTSLSPRPLQVILLWMAGLAAAAQFAKIAVPFDIIGEIYADQGAAVGWLLSLISCVGAFLGIVVGGLVGRFGEKRVLITGLLLGAVISIWQSGFPGFGPMIISRFFEGLSHLAIVVAAPTLIAQLSTDRYRGMGMTLWSTIFGVSFALVAWVVMPVFTGDEIDRLFIYHGVFMLIVAALVLISVPGLARKHRPEFPNILAVHRRAYTTPSIAAPAAGWLFYTLTFVSLLALIPPLLPSDQAQTATGLMPITSTVVSLLVVPVLLRWMRGMPTVLLGFGLAAVLAVVSGFLGSVFGLAIALYGLLGLIQGGTFAAVPELNPRPEDQALAYGFLAQIGNTGNLLGAPLLLLILTAGGEGGMYAAVSTIYVVGVAVLIGIRCANRKRFGG